LVVDVSNPLSPAISGICYFSYNARSVFVYGDYAYVTLEWDNGSMGGIIIIDVNDPSNPTVSGLYETLGAANDVVVSGSYAYVGWTECGWVGCNNRFEVIDISQSNNPVFEGRAWLSQGSSGKVYVSGNYAYLTYSNSSAGLYVIDISYSVNPFLAGEIVMPGLGEGVFKVGSYAYMGADYNGFQVIDVSQPSTPSSAGGYNIPGFPRSIFVSGNYAYETDWPYGLFIANISDPENPVIMGSYDMAGDARDVFVSGARRFCLRRLRLYSRRGLRPAGTGYLGSVKPGF
jgi:hypothetical protein